MTTTIYKYPLPVQNYFFLDLPQGAKILSVQVQHEKPYLWALVSNTAVSEIRTFRLAGTGHPINEDVKILHFIGTFQLDEGSFIGHLFEIIPNGSDYVVST